MFAQDASLRPVGQIPTGTLLYQGRYRVGLVLTTTPSRALYRVWDNNVQRSALILELSTPSHQQAALALEHAAPLLELDHAGIAAIQVIFVERDTLFMGMAFGGGQTIADIMTNRNTPMPATSAVRWIIQAAEVVDFLDSRLSSWSFGDLSASALILTSEDRVQLLGFEIPLRLVSPSVMAHTLPVGSVAPELLNGQCDTRSDVFALAASLHFLLTRQPWNPDASATQSLADLRPDLPNDLLYVIRRGLAVAPGERWENAAAWLKALTNALPPEQATPDVVNQTAPSDEEIDAPTLVTTRGHLQAMVQAEAAQRAAAELAVAELAAAELAATNQPASVVPATAEESTPLPLAPVAEIAADTLPAADNGAAAPTAAATDPATTTAATDPATTTAATDPATTTPATDPATFTPATATTGEPEVPGANSSIWDTGAALPYSAYPWLRNDHMNEITGTTNESMPEGVPVPTSPTFTPRATRWFDVPRLPEDADPSPTTMPQPSWLEMPIVEPTPLDSAWHGPTPITEDTPAAMLAEPAPPVDPWLPSWLREDPPVANTPEIEPQAPGEPQPEAATAYNQTSAEVPTPPIVAESEPAASNAAEVVAGAASASLFNHFVIPADDQAPPPPAVITPIPLYADRPGLPSPTTAWPDQSFEANVPTPTPTPTLPLAATQSKTPSRPLGVLLDRLRGALGGPTTSVGATGTIVLPKHMYPQHVYSILVRLQRWNANHTSEDGIDGVTTVEVEGAADAFYLPVKRLALQTLASGGLSEGTLTVTAQRTTPHGGTDRLIFTFYGPGGHVLHQSSFVAEISILAPNQMTSGMQMITLVHALDR